MKEIIKDQLVWWRFKKEISSCNIVINMYKTSEKNKIQNSVCVLPAAGPGSLGDEAMLRGMKGFFDKQGVKIYPIGLFEDQHWPFLSETIGIVPNEINDWRAFLLKLFRFDVLYINGADMMDAGYGIKAVEKRLILAYIASELGMKVVITGFSFSDKAPKVLAKLYSVLGNNVKFCVRDPFSAKRFSDLTGKRAEQVADLAFMMQAKRSNFKNENVFDWCERSRKANKNIVGINICAHTISEDRKSITPDSIELFLSIYEEGLVKFLSENESTSLVFIPHDLRGLFNDLNLSLILKARLVNKFGAERVDVLELECSADEIKAMVSKLDYVFSGRMHLAIAAIGATTPVACVTYQGKFEGLYDFVGLKKSLLIQNNKFNAESLYKVIYDLKENRNVYKDVLLGSYDKLQSYSNLNLR